MKSEISTLKQCRGLLLVPIIGLAFIITLICLSIGAAISLKWRRLKKSAASNFVFSCSQ